MASPLSWTAGVADPPAGGKLASLHLAGAGPPAACGPAAVGSRRRRRGHGISCRREDRASSAAMEPIRWGYKGRSHVDRTVKEGREVGRSVKSS
jgi:hypothetical protein